MDTEGTEKSHLSLATEPNHTNARLANILRSLLVKRVGMKSLSSSTFEAPICSPPPLVRGYLLPSEYTVQQTRWCLPCNYTGGDVFIPALVYFGGAGVVAAAQEGKCCSGSS